MSQQPQPTATLFVGIDVAAATFHTALTTDGQQTERPQQFPQSPAGFAALRELLAATGHPPAQTLVVMEASGTYWMRLAADLHGAGYGISVINPAQAHYFAQAHLRRAKTDALDAKLLARLAALLRPVRWSPPPQVYEELQQRLAERDALVDIRQQERNRLHALVQRPTIIPAVRARLEELIALCDRQIAQIETELVTVLQQDAAWEEAAHRLRTIPGVGLLTAAWLLVSTLNFSQGLTADQLTAYAGLAPHPHQSGTSVWGRPSIGHTGDGRLRTALYMATLSGIPHNPVLHATAVRLRAAGKPDKVVRCAVARKLLHLARAVVTSGNDFDPAYRPAGRAPVATVA